MGCVAATDVMHALEQERNELLQILTEVASQRRTARGVCWQDAIEHRLAQVFCWAEVRRVAPAAALPMVWQRSKQAARMAAQSTAMARADASNIRQAAMRTVYVVVAFIPAPREVRSRP